MGELNIEQRHDFALKILGILVWLYHKICHAFDVAVVCRIYLRKIRVEIWRIIRGLPAEKDIYERIEAKILKT